MCNQYGNNKSQLIDYLQKFLINFKKDVLERKAEAVQNGHLSLAMRERVHVQLKILNKIFYGNKAQFKTHQIA